ncbi:MAG: CDP-glycerol glycerophosphotransferase family protein [Thomasclavelia sp.]|nr:CDP-glycerol glycerophosphotransferase family protein [Thomasclavelia sp.]
MKHIKKLIGRIIRFVYHIGYRFYRIDNKMIIFISFHGRGYSDNPKAIFEYLKSQEKFKDYTFIWAIKHHKDKNIVIPGAKVIEYFSYNYFKYLAKSKYWVVNCKLPGYIVKKPRQIYLQTWHGTPLKKLAHDIDVSEDTTFYRSGMNYDEMVKTYDNDVKKYNYMISPSSFTTEVFQTSFNINKDRLIETGYPRNDILSNYSSEDVLKIKQKLSIPLDKKVILYAPTWRDNSFVSKGYTFELKVNFKLWMDKLKDDYIVLFKPHYLIINSFDMKEYEGFVYDIDPTVDISSLYIISDILVTDYSSVFFDYAILNRPIYFYMYDIDDYRDNLRGFYLDIYKDLPGDIVENETELVNKIKDNSYNFDKLKEFNKRFNNHEDGKASKRVVDIVFKE